ncbi:hypothetical protein V1282_005687 [Nitrobacteraceae bacterium AZCC 2146]
MAGSLQTYGNGSISIWSKRVTLLPLVQSAMRPAWDSVLSNPVNTQIPSSETTNSLSLARTVGPAGNAAFQEVRLDSHEA